MEIKTISKSRFAACLVKIIEANKAQAQNNKLGNIEDIDLVTSLRKLAASSGVDYASIHKIATGNKNAAWSTVVQIVEGLGLTMEQWGNLYDSVTDSEVKSMVAISKVRKKSKVQKK